MGDGRLPLEGEVVVRRQERPLEAFAVKVDMLADRGGGVLQAGAVEGMALSPDAEGADVDEGDGGIAVVAEGGGGQEIVELFQEDGVVVVRLPEGSVRDNALAGEEVVALGAIRSGPARCRRNETPSPWRGFPARRRYPPD